MEGFKKIERYGKKVLYSCAIVLCSVLSLEAQEVIACEETVNYNMNDSTGREKDRVLELDPADRDGIIIIDVNTNNVTDVLEVYNERGERIAYSGRIGADGLSRGGADADTHHNNNSNHGYLDICGEYHADSDSTRHRGIEPEGFRNHGFAEGGTFRLHVPIAANTDKVIVRALGNPNKGTNGARTASCIGCGDIELDGLQDNYCDGGDLRLRVDDKESIVDNFTRETPWGETSNGKSFGINDITEDDSGIYKLYWSDRCDFCQDTLEFLVRVSEDLQLTLEGPSNVCTEDEVDYETIVTGGVPPYTYERNTTTDDTDYFSAPGYEMPDELLVFITDDMGCTQEAMKNLLTCCQGTAYMPNAFSPNYDGNNDTRYMFPTKEVEEVHQIRIFDRRGELIYETKDELDGRDGTFKGQTLNPGVFVCIAEISCFNGDRKVIAQDITIIK